MTCSRCSHWNQPEDHRCAKCARRLSDRQVESAFHSRGALALQPSIQELAVAEPEPERVEEPRRVPRFAAAMQQSLFSMRDSSKVVSIDGNAETEARPARRPAVTRHRQPTASYLPQQGVLEFVPVPTPQARKLATSVDAKIFCEHPVASVAHRVFAGLYDLGMISALITVFGAMIAWGCDDLANVLTDPMSVSVLVAGALMIGLTYHSLFLAMRGETPGMRFAGLRLVDFDGRKTSEAQLHMRILGAFVSVLPAGLGLLWALVDEESLTWQDHISHTFPTPSGME